jgi:hypothetical protein
MKSQNRVSQLTLELYHRGLATRKERKQVEKALLADIKVQKQYEALVESELEISRLVTKELARLNIPGRPFIQAPLKKKVVVGFVLAAAVLVCALVPAFLYIKANFSNKENAIAEETAHEIETPEVIPEPIHANDKAPSPIAETPRSEPVRVAEPEKRIEPESAVSVAAVPEPDTGVHMRGGSQPEEQPDINIPPGLTLIFENMFADSLLVGIVIPERIKSIAKNAYAGNPVLVVNIGANVDVHDEAIPGNFAKAYNANNRAAGIYTRPNNNSEEWEKLKN